jgi:hypothetical protein
VAALGGADRNSLSSPRFDYCDSNRNGGWIVRTLLRRVRGRLTFANTTSLLALFVALGGTSYAAATLAANSVGSRQIRYSGVHMQDIAPNAVGKSEIGTGAVGQNEIRNDAVGPGELRKDSVRADEIQASAVGTSELQDGGVDLADLSPAAKAAFTLQREAVAKDGTAVAGTAGSVSRTGAGAYTATFGRDVSACQYSATLAAVKNGATTDTPDPGRILVQPGTSATQVDVRTYNDAAPPAAADEPFHLIVAC